MCICEQNGNQTVLPIKLASDQYNIDKCCRNCTKFCTNWLTNQLLKPFPNYFSSGSIGNKKLPK